MTDFQQVISSYESSEAPVFIFNITMQNHGGYDIESFSDDTEFIQIEKKFRVYEDVVTYLTWIKESDKAFNALPEYFAHVKEPVIMCMFRDHQPTVNDEFIAELMGRPKNGHTNACDNNKRASKPRTRKGQGQDKQE